MHAMFLRHEGYLGAIGAFLKGAEECSKLLLNYLFISIYSVFYVCKICFIKRCGYNSHTFPPCNRVKCYACCITQAVFVGWLQMFLKLSLLPGKIYFNYLPDTEKYSWDENYAGSSGLQSSIPTPFFKQSSPWASVDQLEMDRCDQRLTLLPLLAYPKDYSPDSVDLIIDREARYVIQILAPT